MASNHFICQRSGQELFSATIASFMAAQAVDDPDALQAGRAMPPKMLKDLLGPTTIRYWSIKKGWLDKEEGGHTLSLTALGIEQIQDRLAGRARSTAPRHEVMSAWQEIKRLMRQDSAEPLEASLSEDRTIALHGLPAEVVAGAPLEAINERVFADIWARRGQVAFRAQLLEAYGSRCAITGCDVEEALEAAHITPYAEEQAYGLSNGILLRGDIHTLFDVGLLSVDPRSWSVRIAPALTASYGHLVGVAIALPDNASAWPDVQRVQCHFQRWHQQWGV